MKFVGQRKLASPNIKNRFRKRVKKEYAKNRKCAERQVSWEKTSPIISPKKAIFPMKQLSPSRNVVSVKCGDMDVFVICGELK